MCFVYTYFFLLHGKAHFCLCCVCSTQPPTHKTIGTFSFILNLQCSHKSLWVFLPFIFQCQKSFFKALLYRTFSRYHRVSKRKMSAGEDSVPVRTNHMTTGDPSSPDLPNTPPLNEWHQCCAQCLSTGMSPLSFHCVPCVPIINLSMQ